MTIKGNDPDHKTPPEKRGQLEQHVAKELTEREAQHPKQTTLREFRRRLKAYGVSNQAIEAAIATMKAARRKP